MDFLIPLSYMPVIHFKGLSSIVKEIFKDFSKFDLWRSSRPWRKGHTGKLIPPVDSLTSLSYMSIIHSKALASKVKEIFQDFPKFDRWSLSWPWRKGHRGKLIPPVDSLIPLSYMFVIHSKALASIVKEIFQDFLKFDLWR